MVIVWCLIETLNSVIIIVFDFIPNYICIFLRYSCIVWFLVLPCILCICASAINKPHNDTSSWSPCTENYKSHSFWLVVSAAEMLLLLSNLGTSPLLLGLAAAPGNITHQLPMGPSCGIMPGRLHSLATFWHVLQNNKRPDNVAWRQDSLNFWTSSSLFQEPLSLSTKFEDVEWKQGLWTLWTSSNLFQEPFSLPTKT